MAHRAIDSPLIPHAYLAPLRRMQFSLQDLLVLITLNAVVWAMFAHTNGGYIAALQIGGLVTLGYLMAFCRWWEPLTRFDRLLYAAACLYLMLQLLIGFLSGFALPGLAVVQASLYPVGLLCLLGAAVMGMAWLLQVRWDSRLNAYQGYTRLAVCVACLMPMTFQAARQQGVSMRLQWVGKENVAQECHQLMIRTKYGEISQLSLLANSTPPTSIRLRNDELPPTLQRLRVDGATVDADEIVLHRKGGTLWASQLDTGYRYRLNKTGRTYTLSCFDLSQHISWPVVRGSTISFESQQAPQSRPRRGRSPSSDSE